MQYFLKELPERAEFDLHAVAQHSGSNSIRYKHLYVMSKICCICISVSVTLENMPVSVLIMF